MFRESLEKSQLHFPFVRLNIGINLLSFVVSVSSHFKLVACWPPRPFNTSYQVEPHGRTEKFLHHGCNALSSFSSLAVSSTEFLDFFNPRWSLSFLYARNTEPSTNPYIPIDCNVPCSDLIALIISVFKLYQSARWGLLLSAFYHRQLREMLHKNSLNGILPFL